MWFLLGIFLFSFGSPVLLAVEANQSSDQTISIMPRFGVGPCGIARVFSSGSDRGRGMFRCSTGTFGFGLRYNPALVSLNYSEDFLVKSSNRNLHSEGSSALDSDETHFRSRSFTVSKAIPLAFDRIFYEVGAGLFWGNVRKDIDHNCIGTDKSCDESHFSDTSRVSGYTVNNQIFFKMIDSRYLTFNGGLTVPYFSIQSAKGPTYGGRHWAGYPTPFINLGVKL